MLSESNELLDSIIETAKFVAGDGGSKDYDLDFSEESIGSLDDMIDDYFGEDGPSKENFDAMVWAYGSYVAAVIDRHFNGDWYKNEDTGEITFEPELSSVGANPFNWVAKKFDLGDTLQSKYISMTNMFKEDRKSKN